MVFLPYENKIFNVFIFFFNKKDQTPRSLHQHHHSISTPISAQAYPQLLVQTTNEIDISDLKFKDSKLV